MLQVLRTECREGLPAVRMYITIRQLLNITPSITPLTQAPGARKSGDSCIFVPLLSPRSCFTPPPPPPQQALLIVAATGAGICTVAVWLWLYPSVRCLLKNSKQGRAQVGRRTQQRQHISAYTLSLFTLFEHKPPFQISEKKMDISLQVMQVWFPRAFSPKPNR